MAPFFGLLAFIFAVLLSATVAFYLQAKHELRAANEEKAEIQQSAETALARYRSIADLEKYKAEVEAKLNGARAVLPKFQKLAELEQHKEHLTKTLLELKKSDAEWRERISTHESTVSKLVAQTESVEETLDMQSFGFYRPKYGFEDSTHYAQKLAEFRAAQKAQVKSARATHCPQAWTVDGSAATGPTHQKLPELLSEA